MVNRIIVGQVYGEPRNRQVSQKTRELLDAEALKRKISTSKLFSFIVKTAIETDQDHLLTDKFVAGCLES